MKKTGKKWIFRLAFAFFAVTALVSGIKVFSILQEYRAGEQAAQQMQQYVVMEPTEAEKPAPETQETEGTQDVAQPTEEPDTPAGTEPPVIYPQVDFEALLEENPDVVGWILIENTNINYPIVQGTDNEYYVDHLVSGQKNAAGSIFMDFRNEPDFTDKNTVIYGHNMKNKSMFAHINEYRSQEAYEKRSMGKIMTPDGNFRFRIIAGYVASLDDDAWQMDFENEAAYQKWLEAAVEKSFFDSGYEPDPEHRIITLSTCAYDFDDARYILVCRILE